MAHIKRRASEPRPPRGARAADATRNAADAALARGDIVEATRLLEELVRLRPDAADAHNDLGGAYRERWRVEDALRHFRRAVELRPELAVAHYNLGITLLHVGEVEAAVAALEEARRLRPDHPGTLLNLILAYDRCGRDGDTLEPLAVLADRADAAPRSADAQANLALGCANLGRTRQALAILRRAVELAPGEPRHRVLLGLLLKRERRYDEALAAFDRALELDPGSAEARFYRACELLRQGRLAEGFAEYESRADSPLFPSPRRTPDLPRWDGRAPLAGRTILLQTEQGLGDAIQFVRFASLLAERGARVVVECEPALQRLLATCPGVAQSVARGEPLPAADLFAPLLSLPHLLGTDLESIPAETPYLRLPDAPPPAPSGALRLGLAWAGSPSHPDDRNRSLPLDLLSPLLERPGVELVSLQKGAAAAALDTPPWSGRVTDAVAEAKDLHDTAERVRALDLVVSVDTAIAHLAGALGRPVLLLLPFDADWRWMLEGSDSPWYPSMRILRQPRPGDWAAVIAEVCATLDRLRTGEPDRAVELADAAAAAQRTFAEAVQHHLAGDTVEAERLYRQTLTEDPALVEASNNLGGILAESGRRDEALQLFARATELRPDYGEALGNLGLLLSEMERHADAVEALERATRLEPTRADWLNNLGNAYLGLFRFADALGAYDRAIEQEPGYAFAHANRAAALRGLDRMDEATASLREALLIDPGYTAALANLGLLLKESGLREEAVATYHRALEREPCSPVILTNLAGTLQEMGRHEEARAMAARALECDPGYSDAHNIFGNCAHEEGRYDEAVEHFERAVRLNASDANANWNLALLHLLRGDLERGWRQYEWRRRLHVFARDLRSLEQPEWTGEPLEGRSILLLCEQGLGDAIQFVRYAAVLKSMGAGMVYVECAAALAGLLARVPGVDATVVRGEPRPRYDCWAFLLSVPGRVGTTLHSIPATTPYLRAEPRPAADRVGAEPGVLRVGIVWAGAPRHQRDRIRSLPVEALRPLLDTANVRFFSLQKGAACEALAALPAGMVTDLSPYLRTLEDTAAVIDRLDLVVTADTAVAHLAGALGRPAWVMLPHVPDFRWMLERADSPWYPSLRLFRQEAPGDWSGVVDRVGQALERLAAVGSSLQGAARIALPSASTDAEGRPRFTLGVTVEQMRTPGLIAEFEREILGGGHEPAVRAFLDEALGPDDLLVDAAPGLGTVAMSTAVGPDAPRVVVVAVPETAPDAAHQVLINGLHNVEVVADEDPVAAVPFLLAERSARRRVVRTDRLTALVRVTEPEAGEADGYLWHDDGAPDTREAAERLARRGFAHFELGLEPSGAELTPVEAGTPGARVSLSPALLQALLRESAPASSAALAAAGTERRLGIEWPVGGATGWGTYGVNLAVQLARRGDPRPVLLAPVDPASLSPLHRLALRDVLGAPAAPSGFPVLRALGNGLRGAGPLRPSAGEVGVVFFEDTALDPDAVGRGRSMARIVAGSSWNAGVLRGFGLDNVCVSLQGVDPALFHPAAPTGALGDRFVVFSGGKLEYRKGQDLVVAAFREFHRRHPEALLVVAWHNFWPATMAEIDLAGHVRGVPERGADGRLDIAGWLVRNGVPADAAVVLEPTPAVEMARVIREASVALLPSRCEGGTNLVAMECMASGVPTILSANTGHLDLIAPDHCFALWDQRPVHPTGHFRGVDGWGESTVDEILDTLERVHADRAEAARRARLGSEAMHRLSWSSQTDHLIASIQDLF